MMTKSKEETAFGMLDRYARSAYGCFVAEMFPNETGTEYTVCFRPVKNIDKNSPDRFDCGISVFPTTNSKR
jgi:hypothetical protein